MPPEPTLLVTDLDGTLLTSEKTVSPATLVALSEVRAAGIRLAIASARPYRLIESVVPQTVLELFAAVIVSNGAAVIRPGDRAVLREDPLEPADTGQVIAALRAEWPSAGFGWESGREFSSDRAFLQLTRDGGILRDPHPDRVIGRPDEPVHQLVMAVPDAAPRTLLRRVAELAGPEFAVTDSLGGVVEISPASVSKATAAAWWAHSHGAGLADVIAFGDEHNDLPLLTAAGTSVAMGNASAEVRAAATTTTLTNDQDGVAVALRRLLADLRNRSDA